MAKEIREILAFHRQKHVAESNHDAITKLNFIEASVNEAEVEGLFQLPSIKNLDMSKADPLAQTIEAYKNQPLTPELVTQTNKSIWRVRGEIIGIVYEVTPCPYTQRELVDLEANGLKVGYLPAELASQQNRHKLGEMFPKMQSHSVQEGNKVTNDKSPSGWFDYETSIEALYLNTKERQLMDEIKKDNRRILTLNQYIVAGQDNKLYAGQYLDETNTWVRLGSRFDGRIVDAKFLQDGRMRVYTDLSTDYHDPDLGGRSSGKY